MTGTNLAGALLLALAGVFLITRSVTQDATGRTLIDRIIGNPASGKTAVPVASWGGGTFTLAPQTRAAPASTVRATTAAGKVEQAP